MQTLFIRLGSCVVCLLAVASCNIYSPFTSTSSVEDFLEAARDCLHDGDYDCAIENYSKLPDGQLKFEKLCTGYLSKAGFTLNAFINVVTENSNNMLGDLANELIASNAWTSVRETDALNARTNCTSFQTATASSTETTDDDTGNLLKLIGTFVDCALRMAKTDVLHADTPEASTTTACNSTIQRTGDGNVTQSDLGGAAGTGVISAANPGMCSFDAFQCGDAIASLGGTGTNFGDVGDIQDAFDSLPADLQTASGGTADGAIRAGLKGTLAQ